jgi:hypothetical protein
MATIDVKSEVARAIRGEWPAFAASHPNLAAALDETLLLDSAITSLADDPEYREAMATAEAIGAGADVVSNLIQRLVSQWLRRLV